MASEKKGAVHELFKKAIHAKRCPCNNHALNNSLSKSSKVSSCRNATATMKKVVAFANASAKRHDIFAKELGGIAIQGICETRWVERHDGHLQFQGDNLIKICNSLETISLWEDRKTASDAHSLSTTLSSPEFIVASICLNDVFGTTVSLSRFLQTSSVDLKRAVDAVKDTISILREKRLNVDSTFQQLFSEAKEVANQLDADIKVPRIVSKQTHRQNQPNQAVEEYFRRAIYIPLLDSVISDLEERFSSDVLALFQLNVFLPKSSYTEMDILAIKESVAMYQQLLNYPSATTVVAEYKLWIAKWKRELDNGNAIPETVPLMIDNCDPEMYPHVRLFLQILASLPVSVATAERSFSTLRRLKSWLRANMGEERLTGLALLNVHRDINVDVNEVINKFGQSKPRKLNFVI